MSRRRLRRAVARLGATLGARLGAALAALGWPALAAASPAQPLEVSVDAPLDLGTVTAAPGGDTDFRIDADTGAVSRLSGQGERVTGGSVRAVVRISCAEAEDHACDTAPVTVQIAPAGAPTGRLRAASGFNAAAGTAGFVGAPTGGSPLNLTLAPIGEGQTRTFYLGAAVAVAGDDSGLESGAAQASFAVTAAGMPHGAPAQAVGTVRVRVMRALSLARTAGLAFGVIARPAPGQPAGEVSVDAATGQRTLTAGVALGAAAASAAAFTVTGEAGQTVSINVPASFVLSGPSAITVTTSTTAVPSPTLQGAAGQQGSYSFGVGGAFPITATTPPGAYTGSFIVTADYN